MENIQKLLCEMQAAASLETIQALVLFTQGCITHANYVRYNLQIYM